MIHPGYAKKASKSHNESHRMTRSHAHVPASNAITVNNNNNNNQGIRHPPAVCRVKHCQCMNSSRIMAPPPQTRQQVQQSQHPHHHQQQQLNMAVKRSYNGQAVQHMEQFDRYKMTNQDMGIVSTSTCSYQMITPPEAKRSKLLLDQQQQKLQQQKQMQQLQQKHLHEEQQRQAMAAPFWRHPAGYTLTRPQMNATYWPITPPQNFQTPCDFYNCKIFQREHSRYMQQQQQQREQHQRAAQVAAAAQAMRIRTNPVPQQQPQQQQQQPRHGYAKVPAGQTGPVCAGCVNGSCGVAWNKENVGMMRSL